MKPFLLSVTTLVFLISCAGLPPSAGPDDSLVIGSFVLDFPKGFYDLSRMSIENGVLLQIQDKTGGGSFSVYTQKGRFWFMAVAAHDYRLVSYRLVKSIGGVDYHLGKRDIDIAFTALPGKVNYVGDFRYVFNMPLNSRWIAREFCEPDYQMEITLDSATRIDYVYEYSSAPRQWDVQALNDFMKELSPASPWLDREIVEVGK